MHIRSGLAFRSPLHARALPNLQERALKAMRSVGRFRGTLDGSYLIRISLSARELTPDATRVHANESYRLS